MSCMMQAINGCTITLAMRITNHSENLNLSKVQTWQHYLRIASKYCVFKQEIEKCIGSMHIYL